MTNKQPIGFEELWNQAEVISNKVYKEQQPVDLVKELNDLFSNYSQLDNNVKLPDEVSKALKRQCIGQMLFIITHLSGKDNINIYSSLLEEMNLNKD